MTITISLFDLEILRLEAEKMGMTVEDLIASLFLSEGDMHPSLLSEGDMHLVEITAA